MWISPSTLFPERVLWSLRSMRTELFRKKVYLQMDAYDLSRSTLKAGQESEEGGYLPAGIAVRIPEEVRHLRFFVYWNDKERVDLDLHAQGYDTERNPIHVGWDADFKKAGIVHSGDITHSALRPRELLLHT